MMHLALVVAPSKTTLFLFFQMVRHTNSILLPAPSFPSPATVWKTTTLQFLNAKLAWTEGVPNRIGSASIPREQRHSRKEDDQCSRIVPGHREGKHVGDQVLYVAVDPLSNIFLCKPARGIEETVITNKWEHMSTKEAPEVLIHRVHYACLNRIS